MTGEHSDQEADRAALLKAAYAVKSADDNRELYGKWAATYESEFTIPQGYIADRNAAELLCEGFSGAGPVLDWGCGTGLVGVQLRRRGVEAIDGIDISPEMLAQARSKTDPDGSPVYRRLMAADLNRPIDIPSDVYSGIVSIGVFTHGHVGPDGIAELLRVARPGARGVVGVHSAIFEADGFRDRFERYAADGVIEGLDVKRRQSYEDADVNEPNHATLIAVFTVA